MRNPKFLGFENRKSWIIFFSVSSFSLVFSFWELKKMFWNSEMVQNFTEDKLLPNSYN